MDYYLKTFNRGLSIPGQCNQNYTCLRTFNPPPTDFLPLSGGGPRKRLGASPYRRSWARRTKGDFRNQPTVPRALWRRGGCTLNGGLLHTRRPPPAIVTLRSTRGTKMNEKLSKTYNRYLKNLSRHGYFV